MKQTCAFSILILFMVLGLSACADVNDIFNPQIESSNSVKKSKSIADGSSAEKPKDKSSNGSRRVIKTSKGVYVFAVQGDTVTAIAESHRARAAQIAKINGLDQAAGLPDGQRVFVPRKGLLKNYLSPEDLKVTKKTGPSRDKDAQLAAQGTPAMVWPVKDVVVNSDFGWRGGRVHHGVDLKAAIGTPIYSIAEGEVIHAGRYYGYGNLIVVKHPGQYFSAYGHLSKMQVKVGARVKKGQQIALSGRTGRVTGPHLHFEISHGTKSIDPEKILPPVKQ